MNKTITVETLVHAPIEKVWHDFTDPEAIVLWNNASDDWHTTKAENDVREGGAFLSRMEAKNGSAGFDFGGVYNTVIPHERLAYTMGDGRKVDVAFAQEGDNVRVTETFDMENENTEEKQREGWQAILDNFKAYTEAHI
jgi:uncharacterized protein YndB with AHSA1/START domain